MTATPQLGRPVGADGEQTRERVISAAMRCVAEVGYSQATIREIARTAGMTSGSLYHYFPNKADLLKATVKAIEETAFPRLSAAATGDGDVMDRLAALLDESDRLMRDYPHLAAFERAIRSQSAAYLRRGDGRHAGFQPLRDIIGDIIGDAQSRGTLPEGTDPKTAVDAIYALTRGLMEQAANLPSREFHATLQAAKQLIRGTLFRPPAEPA